MRDRIGRNESSLLLLVGWLVVSPPPQTFRDVWPSYVSTSIIIIYFLPSRKWVRETGGGGPNDTWISRCGTRFVSRINVCRAEALTQNVCLYGQFARAANKPEVGTSLSLRLLYH